MQHGNVFQTCALGHKQTGALYLLPLMKLCDIMGAHWRPLPANPLGRITSSMGATFPIFYGICMKEHTCEAKLPHINGKVVRNREISGGQRPFTFMKQWYAT